MSQQAIEKSPHSITEHLGELMVFLDKGFENQAWASMENVNEEVFSLLTQLNKQQLEHPDIKGCLTQLQKKFDVWMSACNEYKAQYAKELEMTKNRELAIRKYNTTDNIQVK